MDPVKLAKAGRLAKQALDLAADALVEPPKTDPKAERRALLEAFERRQAAINEAMKILKAGDSHGAISAGMKLDRLREILAPLESR